LRGAVAVSLGALPFGEIDAVGGAVVQGHFEVPVLVLERAQFPVGAHPGGFQPVPDHAGLVQVPDAVGGQGAAVALGALGAQPGPEPEPAGGEVPGRRVEVAVLAVVGAGVAVAVPPGGRGAVDDADPQRVQGPGQRAFRGLKDDLLRQLLSARAAAVPGGAGVSQLGAEGLIMGAQRPHDAQHVLVPAAVTGTIVIIVVGAVREQGRDDDGGGVRVAVG